jgi:excinuclease UvrABC ATPase subunit
VIIEQNLDGISNADWIIDLAPEAGNERARGVCGSAE